MQTPIYQQIEIDGFTLRWIEFGRGPVPLLAFHGFGQDASVFLNIAQALSARYTVFSFQLFYHGSLLPAGHLGPAQPLDDVTWSKLIVAWCAHQHIKQFSMLGYSLGGRLVLSLIPHVAERIIEVKLLAPDGIQKSFWYHVATHHPIGRRLFYKLIHKPQAFFRIIKWLNQVRLVNDKMYRFVVAQFEPPENRAKVYNVWNFYKNLQPNLDTVKQIMRERSIRSIIVTGDYDPVLPTTIGAMWMKQQEAVASWRRLQAGHDIVKSVYVSELEQWL